MITLSYLLFMNKINYDRLLIVDSDMDILKKRKKEICHHWHMTMSAISDCTVQDCIIAS